METQRSNVDISGARFATAAGAAVLLAGLGLALAYSVAESIANPGITVVDGYWRGQLPWIGIVEALTVGGATATIVAGSFAVLIDRGWGRRALALAAVAIAGAWWFFAVIGAGISGAACAGCIRTVDPWAYAYSAPLLAGMMLIAPALAIAALALGKRRSA